MSITLELPEDLENELSAEAARLGLSLPDYAARVISANLAVAHKPTNGAELIEYWRSEGLIGTRPDIADSPEHARRLRERASHRARS